MRINLKALLLCLQGDAMVEEEAQALQSYTLKMKAMETAHQDVVHKLKQDHAHHVDEMSAEHFANLKKQIAVTRYAYTHEGGHESFIHDFQKYQFV